MKCPFEQLMGNIRGNASLRPRRRTVKLDETGKKGTANIPYDETEISIDVQDLKNQYEKQDGKCYWMDYTLNPNDIFEPNNNAAMSCDRLDNDKGYVKGNFVITTRFANLGKRTMPNRKFRIFMERWKSDVRNEVRKDSIERFC
jgi:hypothetical protein